MSWKCALIVPKGTPWTSAGKDTDGPKIATPNRSHRLPPPELN